MELRLTTSYNASPEEVFAIITDPTFHEQVCERTRALSYDVTVGRTNGDTLVRIRREMPGTDLPEVARRLVGRTLVVVQTRIWHPAEPDGARQADIEGGVPGASVRLSGRTRITPEGESTTEAIELEVTSSVPLIGKRLERVVADAISFGLNTKFEVAWSWLAGTL